MEMKEHGGMKHVAMLLGLLATLSLASQAFSAKSPPSSLVNINTASVEELMTVPGIGKAKAEAIVAYRSDSKFASTEDLMNVKGIGEKLFAKISNYVTVSETGAQVKPGTAEKASR